MIHTYLEALLKELQSAGPSSGSRTPSPEPPKPHFRPRPPAEPPPPLPVELRCRAQFQLQHQAFSNIPVINLRVEGCCLQMPASLASGLGDALSLENLELLHPSLPRTALKAKLAWIQGQGDPETGLVAAGIRFLAAPASFTGEVAAFVRSWAEYERLRSDLDGMPA